MDDVNVLARQIREANRKLPPEKAQHLKCLNVKLRNPVLPQHNIESCAGSHTLTPEEIKRFEEITPIKRGYFTPAEDEIIVENWHAFCKLHDWNPKNFEPFLFLKDDRTTFIHSKRERRKFVQFLADGLPNRTLYSVYHRFRNIYTDHVQRRFLPEEDRMILDHLEHNVHLNESRKYADLAIILKRTRAAIWRRYRLLKKKREIKK
ncbi:hypothetical protein ANTRET_LOCUS331 [Anthophora retusa]